MTSIIKTTWLWIFVIMLLSACGEVEGERGQDLQNVHSLPMESLSLEDLEAFTNPAKNWMVAHDVQSDYTGESDLTTIEGTGAIVNMPTSGENGNLLTEMEHGDIELSLEFLVPKGSNSGLYFQGRYELQILDSWRKTNPIFSDAGGIYERWNDDLPDGDKGYEGKAPAVNASLAPGLWQEYRVMFRAPRFNEAGDKIENARFEHVYLNGKLIHDNAELTGPTRGAISENETETGPLMIQGDHGPLAFRNIRYKLYEQTDSLELSPISYKVYDYNGDRTPTTFDELELLKEGTTDSFNVASVSPKSEHFATHFSADLSVPVSGEYLFETQMGNGGNLYIDGELILKNTGELEGIRPGKIIYLDEGTHQLEIAHFQVKWNTHAVLYYEGPFMEKRTLASKAPWGDDGGTEPLTVNRLSDRPEIIGGFTNYNGKKRTHTLSVGFDEGMHYSYDLQNGALLKFWRDPFADLSQMWVDRGYEQLLMPMNAAVEDMSGSPLLISDAGGDLFNENNSVKEYQLNSSGEPVFHSGYEGVTVTDHIRPDENNQGFIRSLSFSSEEAVENASARIAQSHTIERLSDTLYRIGGRYYIEMITNAENELTTVETDNSGMMLSLPVLQNSDQTDIQYRLIW
ncbi:family 16 glycoside hydrolase [Rhodohalobacter sp. 8-1]|uniref:family 16 glycoside hydrolase n=1 Tax=Rhodohalobacter sp. 8-1 TaxID=3131972 RepID=UPI0030EB83F9